MYTWVAALGGTIPTGARPNGTEKAGIPLFVARAPYQGLQPGKIRAGSDGALFAYNGQEILEGRYEVLMNQGQWAPDVAGRLPIGAGSSAPYGYAIAFGHDSDATPLFVARARHAGGLHPGKYRHGFAGAHIGFDGKEIAGITPFEVLVDSAYEWIPATGGAIPAGCAPNGEEASGEPLYLVRAGLGRGIHPGKIRPPWEAADVPYDGQEVQRPAYEVLFNAGSWRSASGGLLPDGAVVCGFEADGTPLFAARAGFNGGVHLGKVRPGLRGASIGYGGREIQGVNPYEVLVQL